MITGSVRSILPLEYNEEIRDLKITFDLMDRVRQEVPWEIIPSNKFAREPNFTMLAKFLYLNLVEAGFQDVDINEIYDNMLETEENTEAYIYVVNKIVEAYEPKPVKKKSAAPKVAKKSTRKKK